MSEFQVACSYILFFGGLGKEAGHGLCSPAIYFLQPPEELFAAACNYGHSLYDWPFG
ncbi:hypothetical protein [Streptomyces atroolivaceus]|uniref:hypothetical protein n=1 Tax=Streptomyces atroolivaceus TaxID=66869 RepID=UPI0036D41E9D